MSPVANISVHSSQFPETVRRDLVESLRRRQVNHKFHYDSVKQTQKWLALHQVLSPSRADAECARIYDRSFEAAAQQLKAERLHLIGLGCGGGQKDTRLLKRLNSSGTTLFYTPCDVSAAMVLVARQTALGILPPDRCFPFVCDLASADGLPAVFEKVGPPDTARLVTFFGMIPNFEPQAILSKLAAVVRQEDTLLFSANLAPGKDYSAGMKEILPQYDNALTREWLMTFLLDLGMEREDGDLRFCIEEDPTGSSLKRVSADFYFLRRREIKVDAESFDFRPNESIRLFFSYRHTPAGIEALLGLHGLTVLDQWIAQSGEEGVFLCRRK